MQNNIGHNIKRLRTQRKMTQKQLGVAIGFSEATADVRISQYEMGKRTPRKNLLDRIAIFFDVTTEILAEGSADRDIRLLYTLDELTDLCMFILEEIADMKKTIR